MVSGSPRNRTASTEPPPLCGLRRWGDRETLFGDVQRTTFLPGSLTEYG